MVAASTAAIVLATALVIASVPATGRSQGAAQT